MKKSEIKKFGRILALIGAIACLLEGILFILGNPFTYGHVDILQGIGYIVSGIILIIIAAVVFASYGLLNISLKFKVNWVMLLIIGIVAYLFGGVIGALLLILSAIVYLIAEL